MEYTKELINTPLGFATINGVKVTMKEQQLRQLLKAHKELQGLKIGVAGKTGFVPAPEITASWRSLALQTQLVAKGASKTYDSNHRRGTAVDCYADWDYIKKIQPTMNKYGFFNDLAYLNKTTGATSQNPQKGFVAWDGGHWNWISNKHAWGYERIDVLPLNIKEVSMTSYENTLIQWVGGSGATGQFFLVLGGKRWGINPKSPKAINAVFTILMRGMRAEPVDTTVINSIPDGGSWDDYK